MYPNKQWIINTQQTYQHLCDNLFFVTQQNIQYYIKNGQEQQIEVNTYDSSSFKLENNKIHKLLDTPDEFLLYENNTFVKISESYQFFIGMTNIQKQNTDKCKDLLNLLTNLLEQFIEQAISKGISA